MLIVLLVSILTLVFYVQFVKATGAIYIRADGSVDPPTAPINSSDRINYIFTGNIYDSIIVERNNIIVDGANYTIQGAGSGNGIDVSRRTNVAITNMEIRTFRNGIFAQFTTYVKIIGNRIAANYDGVCFWAGDLYSNVTQNTFSGNSQGIEMIDTHNFGVSQNNITNNGKGIALRSSYYGSISRNNIANNSIGIDHQNSYSTISENNITNNNAGISTFHSSNNVVTRNTVTENMDHGISITDSNSNTISGNEISGNGIGTVLQGFDNIISGNTITENNNYGIYVNGQTTGNIIYANNVTINECAIYLMDETANKFYHNNFIGNINQLEVYEISSYDNVWDDDYPSGGNFWSDYSGTDFYSGSYQNLTGSDGIGDLPYYLIPPNTDRYPLMNPFVSPPPPPTYTLTIIAYSGGTTDPAPGTYSYSQGTSVLVKAIPNSGYVLDYWDLDGNNVGNSSSYLVTMDAPHTLAAHFKSVPQTPEFPIGFVFEISFIPILMYLWYRRKHRTPQ